LKLVEEGGLEVGSLSAKLCGGLEFVPLCKDYRLLVVFGIWSATPWGGLVFGI